jgi:hypothetical protein
MKTPDGVVVGPLASPTSLSCVSARRQTMQYNFVVKAESQQETSELTLLMVSFLNLSNDPLTSNKFISRAVVSDESVPVGVKSNKLYGCEAVPSAIQPAHVKGACRDSASKVVHMLGDTM